MRIAVIGCGRIGRLHATALRALAPDGAFAFCDPDLEAARRRRRRRRRSSARRRERCLDAEPPAVVHVCTPPPRTARSRSARSRPARPSWSRSRSPSPSTRRRRSRARCATARNPLRRPQLPLRALRNRGATLDEREPCRAPPRCRRILRRGPETGRPGARRVGGRPPRRPVRRPPSPPALPRASLRRRRRPGRGVQRRQRRGRSELGVTLACERGLASVRVSLAATPWELGFALRGEDGAIRVDSPVSGRSSYARRAAAAGERPSSASRRRPRCRPPRPRWAAWREDHGTAARVPGAARARRRLPSRRPGRAASAGAVRGRCGRSRRPSRPSARVSPLDDPKPRREGLRMKVLVTGATGDVGREVTARLLEDGLAVRALCRAAPDGLPPTWRSRLERSNRQRSSRPRRAAWTRSCTAQRTSAAAGARCIAASTSPAPVPSSLPRRTRASDASST